MINHTFNSEPSPSLFEYAMKDYFDQTGDPRVPHLFLMSSLKPLAIILTIYSIFVLYLGPRLMANRKAFSLKPVLIVYNLCLSLLNADFMYKFITYHNFGLDLLQTERPSFEDRSPATMATIHLQHLYVLSKVVDLLETIFFVLRKKQSQVTGLHFYHHLTVPIQGWFYLRLSGNSRPMIAFAILNSFVHTVMYAYYGLSAIGPVMQPYLWWKRYITQIQIVQFIFLLSYATYFLLNETGHHQFFSINLMFQSLLYIYLFTSFYFQTYSKSKKSTKKVEFTNLDVNHNVKVKTN